MPNYISIAPLFGYFLLYGKLTESETCFCANITEAVPGCVSADCGPPYNSQAVRVTCSEAGHNNVTNVCNSHITSVSSGSHQHSAAPDNQLHVGCVE